MRVMRGFCLATAASAAVAGAGLTVTSAAWAAPQHARPSFLGRFHHQSLAGSTVPGNGDINPYGVAVVRGNDGLLRRGDVLVSNFNNSKNLQGTGTTIVEVGPGGHQTQFAKISSNGLPGPCPGGIGLTTALVVIRGWVIVGSLPSSNGQAATSSAGCLLVLDSQGRVRETIHGRGINGPWDATAVTHGRTASLFVANVLNGVRAAKGAVVHRGTVLRLDLSLDGGGVPSVRKVTTVGSGFSERSDPSAFVVGPTGLGVGRNGILYVADTGTNRITMIASAVTRHKSAGTGVVLTSGGALNSPLGLAVTPRGTVLTVNGGNGRIVETSRAGRQIATKFLDTSGSPRGAGALFGLAVAPRRSGLYYVDDVANTLRLLH